MYANVTDIDRIDTLKKRIALEHKGSLNRDELILYSAYACDDDGALGSIRTLHPS